MRKASIAVLGLLLAATAAASGDVPLGRLPRLVVPERVALELRMDPREAGFSGRTQIAAQVRERTDTFWLHGRDFDIESASLTTASGETLPLKVEVADAAGGVLKVTAPAVLEPGKAQIALAWRAKYNQNLDGAYQVKVGDDAYVLTDMEPLAARRAFPGFDEPSFKTPWDVTLIVPESQNAVANTALVKEEKLADGWKKLRFAGSESLPSYLIAFAVGPWDIVTWPDLPPNAVRKTPLKLRGIAARGRGKQMTYALQHTAEIVTALEVYFDYPYPFDKLDLLAAPDYSGGAMENAGLIVYRETLLLDVDKAPTSMRQGYWNTHAHELSHQWFGNLVTMPWWDDLWLNEAFATWMASKIVHQLQPEFHSQRKLVQSGLGAMAEDSLASTRRIHEPVQDYTDVLSAFDGITYLKGGAMLAMFESFLGEEKFRAAVRAHMRTHARGNATSGDLMQSLAQQSPQPAALQAAFASFTDQPGVPFLSTELDCRTEPRLIVKQRRYLPLGSEANENQRWSIPVCLRYPQAGGVRKQCALIEDEKSEILLDTQRCPAWLHPNADGAGYYRFALAASDRAGLDAAFEQLNEREQRVYADSLNAAFFNGSLSAADFLAATPKLAASAAREVALAPRRTLVWMWEHAADDAAEREALQAWIAQIYRPRLDAIGLDAKADDSDETKLLRNDLVALLGFTAREPTLAAALAGRGRSVLGIGNGGELQASAIDPDRRGIALAMAARLGGAAEFEAIERHFRASQDALLRGQLLGALGEFQSPELAAKARALVLDPVVKPGEIGHVLYTQFLERELRDAARVWFREHFDAVFEKVPATWQAGLPDYDAIESCSETAAADLHQRYHARMAKVEGGPRALTQSEESIRLCAALQRHHAEAAMGVTLAGRLAK